MLSGRCGTWSGRWCWGGQGGGSGEEVDEWRLEAKMMTRRVKELEKKAKRAGEKGGSS